jgi:hypothetical protein
MSEQARTNLRTISLLALLATTFAIISFFPIVFAQEKYPANLYSGLRWRNIGPFRAVALTP